MTNAQILLVEENINLIHKFCAQHNISDEDIKQELFEAVCAGISQFDPSRGKISTFIFTTCKNKLIFLHNKDNRKKIIPPELIRSLDAPVGGLDSEDQFLYQELYGKYDFNIEKFESEDFINKFIEAYKKYYPKNKKMVPRIKKLLEGRTMKSIALEEGVSVWAVCLSFRELKDFYNCYLNNDYTILINKESKKKNSKGKKGKKNVI